MERHGVRISMDGKGRYTDNIFVERLWKTVKYEKVYLNAFTEGRQPKTELDYRFRFYNNQRPHGVECGVRFRGTPGHSCSCPGAQ